MTSRLFVNLPALRTRADVEAVCERLGVVQAGGYRAIDGLRVCVELPDVAIDEVSEEAKRIECRDKLLKRRAETILVDSQVQKGAR